MSDALVIGLDSSTQSTKAIAWNVSGEAVAIGRADIPMSNPRLDCFEQNSDDDWWSACLDALKECVINLKSQGIEASAIQGLAISNQRETLGFFDKDVYGRLSVCVFVTHLCVCVHRCVPGLYRGRTTYQLGSF